MIFIKGEGTKNTEAFTLAVSKFLPNVPNRTEYSAENPYIAYDLLEPQVGGFAVDIDDEGMLPVLAMSWEKKVPIIFFGNCDYKNLLLKQRFFLEHLKMSGHAVIYADNVDPEKNEGVSSLVYACNEVLLK